MQTRTRQLTLSAMFTAFGVLFPIVFHSLGLGSTFLPMFWPIAVAAYFLSTPIAVATAVASPLLSSLLTGMPPISPPILHVMLAELIMMVLGIRLFFAQWRRGALVSLAAGLAVSRFTLFLIILVAAPLLGLPAKVFSTAMVVRGVPGIIGMLILLPIAVARIKRVHYLPPKKAYVTSTSKLLQ